MKPIFKVSLYGSAGERQSFFVRLNVGGVCHKATVSLHKCIRDMSKDNYFGRTNEFEIFWKDDVGDLIQITAWRDLQNFVLYQSRRYYDYLKLFVHPKGYINGEIFDNAANNNSFVPIIVINQSL